MQVKESGCMNQVYSKQAFKVYRAEGGYVIHNTDKKFKDGHTHLTSFKSAKYLIDLALHKSLPYHLDTYRLISLVRISLDEEYRAKIKELVSNKKHKDKYVNCSRKCG